MLREICYFCLARSAAESRHGGLDVSLFFLVHLFRPLISKLTGPIFAKFSGFLRLWMGMFNRKSVFQSFRGSCHGNQILSVLVHGCRWTQVASGAAGWANVGLCPVFSEFNFSASVHLPKQWGRHPYRI